MPVAAATREPEVGGSLELGRWRPQRAKITPVHPSLFYEVKPCLKNKTKQTNNKKKSPKHWEGGFRRVQRNEHWERRKWWTVSHAGRITMAYYPLDLRIRNAWWLHQIIFKETQQIFSNLRSEKEEIPCTELCFDNLRNDKIKLIGQSSKRIQHSVRYIQRSIVEFFIVLVYS